MSATVCECAGRWYVSFGCQVEHPEAAPAIPGAVIGVDVGVKSLAVCSTGEVVPNPKHASRYARRMARIQRQCSRRSGPAKGRPPSKRWQRSAAKLGRTHAKVANTRSDGLHKLTTRLASTYGTIVVEDLNVAGMTASAKGSGHWRGKAGLNRAVLDASPAELRRQLAYKTTWYGSALVVAERWYPSSKTCSACKTVKAKLSLAERTYTCEHCGLVIDRDQNAAANLASLVEAVKQPVPPVGREPAHCSAGAAGRTDGERRGSWAARPGAPRRTVKTAPADPGRIGPSPPPGNRWLRSPLSSKVTDETDFGTVLEAPSPISAHSGWLVGGRRGYLWLRTRSRGGWRGGVMDAEGRGEGQDGAGQEVAADEDGGSVGDEGLG
ncbi:MAG: RNA-guided endonuclease InsQ/TnpB family protein, partial [Acidimicrobiales bacterium]